MMNIRTLGAGIAVACVLGTIAPCALAETPDKPQNYAYTFHDDDLLGKDMTSTGAQINVLPMGRRDRLLRPRVHFVAEMLKSVENM